MVIDRWRELAKELVISFEANFFRFRGGGGFCGDVLPEIRYMRTCLDSGSNWCGHMWVICLDMHIWNIVWITRLCEGCVCGGWLTHLGLENRETTEFMWCNLLRWNMGGTRSWLWSIRYRILSTFYIYIYLHQELARYKVIITFALKGWASLRKSLLIP